MVFVPTKIGILNAQLIKLLLLILNAQLIKFLFLSNTQPLNLFDINLPQSSWQFRKSLFQKGRDHN